MDKLICTAREIMVLEKMCNSAESLVVNAHDLFDTEEPLGTDGITFATNHLNFCNDILSSIRKNIIEKNEELKDLSLKATAEEFIEYRKWRKINNY